MKTQYVMAIWACFTIVAAGCGKSSSSDGNQTQLKTQEDAFDSFCLNNPNSEACYDIAEEGKQVGLNDYYGWDENYSDQAFNGAGGFCGCPSGQNPVIFNGRPLCEETITHNYQRSEFRLKLRQRRRGKKLWASYDYVDASETETRYTYPTGNSDSCFREVEMRCSRPQHCDGLRNDYGQQVQTSCNPIPNRDYGACQQRRHQSPF